MYTLIQDFLLKILRSVQKPRLQTCLYNIVMNCTIRSIFFFYAFVNTSSSFLFPHRCSPSSSIKGDRPPKVVAKRGDHPTPIQPFTKIIFICSLLFIRLTSQILQILVKEVKKTLVTLFSPASLRRRLRRGFHLRWQPSGGGVASPP
jgi:hypothetical protein